jgi:hypothetical protein
MNKQTKEISMNLMKHTMILACVNIFCLGAFADSASNDAKLALLTADSSRLETVQISAFDPAIKAEQINGGDESSTTTVTISANGQNKTYMISRDGGGQILSIVLVNK